MYAKLKPITSSKSASRKSRSPHPSHQTAELLGTERVRRARSKAIAAETRASIDEFESSIRGRVAATSGQDGESIESGEDRGGDTEKLSPTAGMVVIIMHSYASLSQGPFSQLCNVEKLGVGLGTRLLVCHMEG